MDLAVGRETEHHGVALRRLRCHDVGPLSRQERPLFRPSGRLRQRWREIPLQGQVRLQSDNHVKRTVPCDGIQPRDDHPPMQYVPKA